ncbi:type II toxin-antitoxin system HicB family antitoxin [Candidatus Woesearchaeota archaeon]|nr:type II toxin-antitoxin system HicB family antitoxin [Candidatus Woesearchaeota archaeon]
MEIKVVLEKQKEGGYTVYAPSLPGCISQGETRKEALANIREAIELYLETDANEMMRYEGELAEVKI